MTTPMSPDTSAPGAELHGRTALVTGSSRGIGRAIAVLFAQRGATVVLHGRDRSAMVEVHEQNHGRGRVSRAGHR